MRRATSSNVLDLHTVTRSLTKRGWVVVTTDPTRVVLSHPSSRIEHPTPSQIPTQRWPSPTYTITREIVVGRMPGRRTIGLWVRTGPPWRVRERKVPLRAALTWTDQLTREHVTVQ